MRIFNFFFLAISFSKVWANDSSLKDDLWEVSYQKAWEKVITQKKPLFLLVVDESSDPWQMSLFDKVAVREVLKEGFISLIISSKEKLAEQLPIKSIPVTFIISPNKEALLSYQGLLWEEEFFRVVVPFSSVQRDYTIENSSEKSLIQTNKEEKKEPEEVLLDKQKKFVFEEGIFYWDIDSWKLNYKNQLIPLSLVSSMEVAHFFLLENKEKGIIYALPLDDTKMSYFMDKDTEIWQPFFLIYQK